MCFLVDHIGGYFALVLLLLARVRLRRLEAPPFGGINGLFQGVPIPVRG